jgi:hypothetical protein
MICPKFIIFIKGDKLWRHQKRNGLQEKQEKKQQRLPQQSLHQAEAPKKEKKPARRLRLSKDRE